MIDDILEEWGKDSKITLDTIVEYSLNVPYLNAKYLKRLIQVKEKLRSFNKKFRIFRYELREYYRCNRNTKDALSRLDRPPNQEIVSYSLMEEVLNGDEQYVELKYRLESLQEEREMLEEILKELSRTSYHIKNAIDWKRFENGEC